MIKEQLQDLIAAGTVLGTTPAGDAWKWDLGDVVVRLQDLVRRAEDHVLAPGVAATAEARETLRECRAQYDRFLRTQDVPRNRLVDYGYIARRFPPGHPVRGGISFSHAKALASLPTPEERTLWATRAARERLSVAALRAQISACTQGKSKPRTAQICAHTGRTIRDLTTMVEVRLVVGSVPPEALPALPRGRTKIDKAKIDKAKIDRAGAAGDLDPRWIVLQFESLTALLAWAAERQADPLTRLSDL